MRAAASSFVFLYPVVMAFVWMIGGLYFYLRREHGAPRVEEPPALDSYPLVSLVVPCHDEGPNVRETVRSLLDQRYPQIEVVALDDGSTDDTGAILDALAATDPRLRVVHLAENQGKAVALRTAALPPAASTWSASTATRSWTSTPRTGWSPTCCPAPGSVPSPATPGSGTARPCSDGCRPGSSARSSA